MATPKINENCHHVQNDPHKCKIKLEKFNFDILCRFGVIKESLPEERNPAPGEIGLTLLAAGGVFHLQPSKWLRTPKRNTISP